jgi:hypothetical protein
MAAAVGGDDHRVVLVEDLAHGAVADGFGAVLASVGDLLAWGETWRRGCARLLVG